MTVSDQTTSPRSIPENRTFTFSDHDRWIVVAALEGAEDIVRNRERSGSAIPSWPDDPDVGALTVTLAMATRLHLVERAEA